MADDDKKDPPAKGEPDDDLGDKGKKALDDERRARREAERELKELRAEVQSLKDRDKSEGEKLNDRIKDAEKKSEAAEAKALRLEVAMAKGLNAAQAKRLVGTTKEELETDADDILETFSSKSDDDKDKGDGKGTPRKPTEDLRGGGDPTREPKEETDPRKLAESVPRY